MKPSQKLIVCVENLEFTARFDSLDKALLPVAKKLETDGDEFGPVSMVIFAPNDMCVSMRYADKWRGPSRTIFGYDEQEFMSKQYK